MSGPRSIPSQHPIAPNRHYHNFNDAFGLVGRMLTSRNRSAWWALVLAAARLGVTPIDRLLTRKEVAAASAARSKTGPMLLVVGAPRAGTTLAYQVFAAALDVSYFRNLTALFEGAPMTATKLSEPLTGRLNGSFANFYGNTSGLSGPNDGFTLWNRWLGDDRYTGPETISDETEREMRQFFAAWSESFDKPFLNKNNRNSDCVPVLAKALPEAVFVEVRRDRHAVARSLLRARSMVQGSTTEPWGLRSTDPGFEALTPIDQVCRQVLEIERRLDEAQDLLGPDRFLRVGYADLCSNPAGAVSRVLEHFESFHVKPGFDLRSLVGFENAGNAHPPGEQDEQIRCAFDKLLRPGPVDRALPPRRDAGGDHRLPSSD